MLPSFSVVEWGEFRVQPMLAIRRIGSNGIAPAFHCMVSAIGALVVVGCAPSIKGAPPRLVPVGIEIEQIRQISGPEWYSAYVQAGGLQKSQLRDQIVFSRMYAIDLFYNEYELRLTRERQNVGFWFTVANLAVTTTGTLVGGEETKTILHAAATGLTGTKEAYDKNILIDRTIAVLQEQMRAGRKTIRVQIIQKLALSTSAYPLEFALSDLEDYYTAGTITGALIGVSHDASRKLALAEAIEEELFSASYGKTDLAPRIRVFWRANRSLVEEWLVRNGINAGPTLFINSAEFAAEQARMVRELGIP